MKKPVVLVTAPVATRSGYGAHSRDIIRSLINIDKYDVKIWPVKWGSTPMNALNDQDPNDKPIIERLLSNPTLPNKPDVHIHIVVPNEFSPIGKYNIGITAGLECTACPPSWLEGMNRMDLNIVPSTFVKNTMENVSFDIQDENTKQLKGQLKNTKPIEVLFEGADTNIYKKTKEFSKTFLDEMKNVEESFNFLYVGHWLQGKIGEDRKDTAMLVKVFLETFKNKKKKPGLILKTSGASFSVLDREDILKKINKIKQSVSGDLPNIYLLHGDFYDDEINELYNHPKVKAHITFTHGEGFGRPLLEATQSGKPVIAPGWSGHVDFLNQNYAVLLPGTLNRAPKEAFPKDILLDVPENKWITVNYSVASNIMRDIHNNYQKYLVKAKQLQIYTKQKFSFESMKDILGKKVDSVLDTLPKSVELKLPKLNKVDDKKINLPKLKKA